jgi:hypothetical protein
MRDKPSRREFVAGAAALAAGARFFPTGGKDTRRTLIDPCNQIPLAGAKLNIVNQDSGVKSALRTAEDGSWDLGPLIAAVTNSAGERIRIRVRPLTIGGYDYAGIDYRALLKPGAENNSEVGRLALVPLSGAGRALGIVDEEFEAAWPALLRDALFAAENTPGAVPKGAARGAIRRFERKRFGLRPGLSLSAVEAEFAGGIITGGALSDLTAGGMRISGTTEIPAAGEPFFEADLPAGTITLIKRTSYPKPVVRLRFSERNPHEIVAALIVLDDATLDSFFRAGEGSEEEIAYARHIVQRCLAEALGYRPTARLPNRTLLDANFDPPGGVVRTGIRQEDVLLARVLYGAHWLRSGSRWAAHAKQVIMTDPAFA